MELTGGCEWVVEAHGCDPALLGNVPALQALFNQIIDEMDLHPVAPAAWHKFSGPGGVTGLAPLAESHLACHTFPEYSSICLNLFCCRPRADWDWEQRLQEKFGAKSVHVRCIERPYHS